VAIAATGFFGSLGRNLLDESARGWKPYFPNITVLPKCDAAAM